ncbi:ComF family protein [uncultured Tessaracoccus sp.]|uniref:ComF family protein n=1 Tax=uncultured Tessaracoccus sp. TaxID=905023 RepID=UPI0026306E8F|nr:phosphoribosyltransferase family protein [uncultured Tessaracoccus sp.]
MNLIDALADLLLGAQCPGCDQPRWGLCPECALALDVAPTLVERAGVPTIMAANPYRPHLSNIIPRYKDDGALHIERALANRLAVAVEALQLPSDTWLVPIPSRPSAVRARGFDHAARLAGAAARATGLRSRRGLRRSSRGADQLELSRASRSQNMRASMRSTMHIGRVVVVDDIVTTGASLAEGIRALECSGVDVLAAAVIANVDKPAQS